MSLYGFIGLLIIFIAGRLTSPAESGFTTVLSSLQSATAVTGNATLRSALSTGCMELVESSHDALTWSILSITRKNGNQMSGTGDRSSDLRAWLSGAIAMLQTCLDDIDSSDVHIKERLTEIVALAKDLLQKVRPSTEPEKTPFPTWVSSADLGIIGSVSFQPDVVVAKDGSGNFSTITEAIAATPDQSMRRHVIFVKAGKYDGSFV